MSELDKSTEIVKLFFEGPAAYRSMTVSGLVTLGRTRIGIVQVAGGTADTKAIFYDGIDSSGKVAFTVPVLIGNSFAIDFKFTVLFERGIFLSLSGAGAGVFISFTPVL